MKSLFIQLSDDVYIYESQIEILTLMTGFVVQGHIYIYIYIYIYITHYLNYKGIYIYKQ